MWCPQLVCGSALGVLAAMESTTGPVRVARWVANGADGRHAAGASDFARLPLQAFHLFHLRSRTPRTSSWRGRALSTAVTKNNVTNACSTPPWRFCPASPASRTRRKTTTRTGTGMFASRWVWHLAHARKVGFCVCVGHLEGCEAARDEDLDDFLVCGLQQLVAYRAVSAFKPSPLCSSRLKGTTRKTERADGFSSLVKAKTFYTLRLARRPRKPRVARGRASGPKVGGRVRSGHRTPKRRGWKTVGFRKVRWVDGIGLHRRFPRDDGFGMACCS